MLVNLRWNEGKPFIAGVLLFSPDLLRPYRSAAGQVWLVVPCGVWAACMAWLRRLMRFDQGARYRLRRAEQVVS